MLTARIRNVLMCAGVVVALSGCSGSASNEPAAADPTAQPSTSSAPTTSAATGPTLVQSAAAVEVPRTLHYAGAQLTVTRATFSNATPHTYGDADADPSDVTRLYVELRTEYENGYPGADARFALADLLIRTADGRSVPAQALDQSGVPILATTTTTATVHFDVEPSDLDGATLVFDDGDHEAGVLPLRGPVPATGYPVGQVIGDDAAVVFPSGCGRSTAQVELAGIEWDLDAGLDSDGERVVTGRSARAATGSRMARVRIDVVAGADRCGGTFVNYQNVRLSIDGIVTHPLNTPSVTLQDGEGAELVFGFEVPLDAAELVLLVGAPDASPWSPTVEIPSDLP